MFSMVPGTLVSSLARNTIMMRIIVDTATPVIRAWFPSLLRTRAPAGSLPMMNAFDSFVVKPVFDSLMTLRPMLIPRLRCTVKSWDAVVDRVTTNTKYENVTVMYLVAADRLTFRGRLTGGKLFRIVFIMVMFWSEVLTVVETTTDRMIVMTVFGIMGRNPPKLRTTVSALMVKVNASYRTELRSATSLYRRRS